MAITSTFSNMLNEYLSYDLLKEEIIKRDYVLTKVEKDDGWKGGTLPVPFKGAGASSIAMGQMTDETDVAEDILVRGSVAGYKEMFGTLVFNQKDLMQHDGTGITEKTFLKILPDSIEDFMVGMKNQVSCYLTNGSHLVTATADGDVSGNITVDRPDRLSIGQKLTWDDSAGADVTAYVKSINMETLVVNFVTTRGGAIAADLSTILVAQGAKAYVDGANVGANKFSAIKDMLLSAANGGSATIFGVTKSAYPYTQAIQIPGSAVNASNLLDKIFDGYITIRTFGKGDPREVLMSYKHWGSVLKKLESSKGAFNVVPGSMSTSVYGWTEVEVGGIKGSLKLIAIQELDNDAILFIDWRAFKFHSNGFFKRVKDPEGKEFYTKRYTTGYKYFVDMALFGDLICSRPSYCGIMSNIPNY